ncbi:GNAT family N-acetyltransferase [Gallaecimonas mangrovi]|uniref:GNAT family N-acetyltransferase n=1 Tax=Gallaecimonas mangrovi TaxID=2291597 RepID=UPI000E20648E|nr:GNAT family N-acetyltransferase [Gallaecimonas mangrovi]
MWTHKGDVLLSDDNAMMQLDVIHGFLSQCYWSAGISRQQVASAMAGSYCFGLFKGAEQIAFGRLITDYATFAYLADVFVLPSQRKKGLAKWMLAEVFAQPWALELRRILLATRDAHSLYQQLGFKAPTSPQNLLEVHRLNIYQNCTHTIKEAP